MMTKGDLVALGAGGMAMKSIISYSKGGYDSMCEWLFASALGITSFFLPSTSKRTKKIILGIPAIGAVATYAKHQKDQYELQEMASVDKYLKETPPDVLLSRIQKVGINCDADPFFTLIIRYLGDIHYLPAIDTLVTIAKDVNDEKYFSYIIRSLSDMNNERAIRAIFTLYDPCKFIYSSEKSKVMHSLTRTISGNAELIKGMIKTGKIQKDVVHRVLSGGVFNTYVQDMYKDILSV